MAKAVVSSVLNPALVKYVLTSVNATCFIVPASFVTNLSASTKVVDRNTGEVHVGRVPAYSVVVPGSLPGKSLPDGSQGPSLYCAVIVKKVDAQTRSKTSVNELLRD